MAEMRELRRQSETRKAAAPPWAASWSPGSPASDLLPSPGICLPPSGSVNGTCSLYSFLPATHLAELPMPISALMFKSA